MYFVQLPRKLRKFKLAFLDTNQMNSRENNCCGLFGLILFVCVSQAENNHRSDQHSTNQQSTNQPDIVMATEQTRQPLQQVDVVIKIENADEITAHADSAPQSTNQPDIVMATGRDMQHSHQGDQVDAILKIEKQEESPQQSSNQPDPVITQGGSPLQQHGTQVDAVIKIETQDEPTNQAVSPQQPIDQPDTVTTHYGSRRPSLQVQKQQLFHLRRRCFPYTIFMRCRCFFPCYAD